MTMRIITTFLIAIAGTGCATLQTHQALQQETGTTQSTHAGGVVFRAEKRRDLENAFGGADIFGRTTYAGFTELRYLGTREDGKPVFRVTEARARTNETTMSRTGVGVANTQANVQTTATGARGSATTTYSVPTGGDTELLPPTVTEFAMDVEARPRVTIDGVTVTVIEAAPHGLEYRLSSEQDPDTGG